MRFAFMLLLLTWANTAHADIDRAYCELEKYEWIIAADAADEAIYLIEITEGKINAKKEDPRENIWFDALNSLRKAFFALSHAEQTCQDDSFFNEADLKNIETAIKYVKSINTEARFSSMWCRHIDRYRYINDGASQRFRDLAQHYRMLPERCSSPTLGVFPISECTTAIKSKSTWKMKAIPGPCLYFAAVHENLSAEIEKPWFRSAIANSCSAFHRPDHSIRPSYCDTLAD